MLVASMTNYRDLLWGERPRKRLGTEPMVFIFITIARFTNKTDLRMTLLG